MISVKSLLFIILPLTGAFGQPKKVNQGDRGTDKPNIILIMADDMGYECLGSYGSASYRTPHLDRLAEYGVRFQHCYSQPLCTPSRVKIMTGQHNFRNYTAFGYLNPSEKTFGNVLQEAGYATCVVGKWQLNGISGGKRPGWDDTDRPHHFGFDEYCLWQLHNTRSEGERFANPLLVQNGQQLPRDENQYGPDVFCDYIVDFIDRKKRAAFLCLLSDGAGARPFRSNSG